MLIIIPFLLSVANGKDLALISCSGESAVEPASVATVCFVVCG